MERAEAIALLPADYAVALRMAESGASERSIAAALGVEPAAIRSLLKLAETKLQHLLDDATEGEAPSG